MHYPDATDGTLLLWYFIIAGILLGLLIGLGYAYGKILKKYFRRILKAGKRPYKERQDIGKK